MARTSDIPKLFFTAEGASAVAIRVQLASSTAVLPAASVDCAMRYAPRVAFRVLARRNGTERSVPSRSVPFRV